MHAKPTKLNNKKAVFMLHAVWLKQACEAIKTRLYHYNKEKLSILQVAYMQHT